MFSEMVISMSIILGILNYILLAIVVGHMIEHCTDPIVKPIDDDPEETETSDLRRAA
ncbi:MAG: hypothetical protein LZF60_360095 [Nitrospira sp.]|nr:MAG: hypothetical protein LZF60_360095 [Nitrospira sp.]